MPNEISGQLNPQDACVGVVVARWNEAVTERLLEGALATLRECGVPDENIDVARVPGAWEIPLAAQRFARSSEYDAVICLGAVIRGETTHDEHINRAVTMAMSKIALKTDTPVLLGLLTCQSLDQALQRAGGAVGNKGSEAAQSALAMIGLLQDLPPSKRCAF